MYRLQKYSITWSIPDQHFANYWCPAQSVVGSKGGEPLHQGQQVSSHPKFTQILVLFKISEAMLVSNFLTITIRTTRDLMFVINELKCKVDGRFFIAGSKIGAASTFWLGWMPSSNQTKWKLNEKGDVRCLEKV